MFIPKKKFAERHECTNKLIMSCEEPVYAHIIIFIKFGLFFGYSITSS